MTRPFDQAFWDARYSSAETLWSGNPNHPLVVETAGLVPGFALDVGAGEGADAIWLAEHGWRVTAVDISPVALERAAAHAAGAGAEVADRITWLQCDLADWEPAADRYDLVSAHYFHMPTDPRRLLFDRLASAVVRGGTLLIVGHDRFEGSEMPEEYFFSSDEVAAQLPPERWAVITNAVVERPPTGGHSGEAHHLDIVMRAQRRA
jgi:SAM-dependent methyltransferase